MVIMIALYIMFLLLSSGIMVSYPSRLRCIAPWQALVKYCVVGPTYLAPDILPSAADILYHKSLIYSIPTGFHPVEIRSIYSFPKYCSRNKYALPNIYWNFCYEYFLNSKLAHDCLNILEPLRKEGNIKVVAYVYGRNSDAIAKAFKIMNDNPQIADILNECPFPSRFIAREFLSHVLYEVYLEKNRDYIGVLDYLKKYQSKDEILELIRAVLVNRLKIFSDPRTNIDKLLVHSPFHANAILKLHALMAGKISEKGDEEKIDEFAYRLFSQLLFPIFGICDTRKKSTIVGRISREKTSDIDELINECRFITSETLFLQTKDKIKKERLLKLVRDRITAPLADLCQKHRNETKRIIVNYLTESGIMAALLSSISTPSLENTLLSLSISVTAASVSTLLRLFTSPSLEPKTPSKLLLTSLRKMNLNELSYLRDVENALASFDVS